MNDLYGEHHRLSTELGLSRRRSGGLLMLDGGGGEGGDEGWMGMDPVQWFQPSRYHLVLEQREHLVLSPRPSHGTASNPPHLCQRPG